MTCVRATRLGISCVLFALCSAAKAEQLIGITTTDGKTPAGEFVQADPQKVTVRCMNESGEGTHDVEVKWSDVKKITGGLTRATALAPWKKENADRLCPQCTGDGILNCPQCRGTGLNTQKKAVCPKCKGEGTISCPVKDCVKGKADCPGDCLKLSVGKWEKGKDGLRWRKFTYGNGQSVSWSERHVGQVVSILGGEPKLIGACPICRGSTKVECARCKGTSIAQCDVCFGAREVSTPCDECHGGKTTCALCKGTGLK